MGIPTPTVSLVVTQYENGHA